MENAFPSVIAIDGPAAAGKSTVGKRLADRLGFLYFDTGVMYRAITWAALRDNLPIDDEGLVTELARRTRIDVKSPSEKDGRDSDVLVDEQDVTWEIRSPEVDANVSAVSAYPGVRQALTAQQRRIGLGGQVVMVGRDIGTVVLPEADLKLYLYASVEERARRRFLESAARGEDVSLESINSAMARRDQLDSTRVHAPLKPAGDALLIDSDGLEIDQVLQTIYDILGVEPGPSPDG